MAALELAQCRPSSENSAACSFRRCHRSVAEHSAHASRQETGPAERTPQEVERTKENEPVVKSGRCSLLSLLLTNSILMCHQNYKLIILVHFAGFFSGAKRAISV